MMLRSSRWFLLAPLSLLACAAENEPEVSEDELKTAPPVLEVRINISNSKLAYDSTVHSFSVAEPGAAAPIAPCRDELFFLQSKPSLFELGWSKAVEKEFSEELPGTTFRKYKLASCRTGDTSVRAYFGVSDDYSISGRLLADDYKPTKQPLMLEYGEPGSTKKAFYKCDGNVTKTKTSETANATTFDLRLACKLGPAPSDKQRGMVAFLDAPLSHATQAAYENFILPETPSSKAAFAKVKAALLGKVPAGTYAGAMSTLSKTCELSIRDNGDSLAIEHTIVSSGRTRKLVLDAKSLLGFAEGDLYKEPTHVRGATVGKGTGAQFEDGNGGKFTLLFENNTAEGSVVRINGSDTYCRRLKAK